MTIRTATGLIAAYMRMCGFKGWTSFWRVIYMLPGYEDNKRLLRHMNGIGNPVLYERKHLEQIENDGRLLFALRYSWLTLRHGYFMNPYEVENEFTSFILGPRGGKQNNMTEQTRRQSVLLTHDQIEEWKGLMSFLNRQSCG